MNLIVTHAGFRTTIQDLGRIGFRQFGVSSGGALDLHALRVANLLTGNDESAAGLEFTQGNIRLRFEDERVISWCGGDYEVCVASHSIPPGHSALVLAKDELSISGPRQGWRGWIAVSGGIAVPPVLGSRSTDLPLAPAGSAFGPTITKSLYMTGERFSPKPSATNFSSENNQILRDRLSIF